jgi:hypothetical protein
MTETVDRPRPEGDPDDVLLADLGRVLRAADPVPPDVALAARSALAWLRLDAELAELAYDSLLDESWLAGVRGAVAEQPRLMTFTTDDVSLEVQVSLVVMRRRLVGQIVPPQPARVDVRHESHPDAVMTAAADHLGRFIVDDVDAGPISLRCRLLGGGEERVIETDWVIV